MQHFFISAVDIGGLTPVLSEGFGPDLLGCLTMILGITDAAQYVAGSQVIRFDPQLGHGQLHRGELVVVVNGEVAREPGCGRFAPQDPRAQRMTRGNPRLAGREAGAQQQIRDAVAQFLGGFVVEGHIQYLFVRLALGEPERQEERRNGDEPAALGERQLEVARLVAEGLSNKQIATKLFLSQRTIDSHVRTILNKLGFNSRAQIAGWVASLD